MLNYNVIYGTYSNQILSMELEYIKSVLNFLCDSLIGFLRSDQYLFDAFFVVCL